MPFRQESSLTPECEAELYGERLREATDAKEKLERTVRQHDCLIQVTEAAENYYKKMLDEGHPPSKRDAEAAAIEAQRGALRELMD